MVSFLLLTTQVQYCAISWHFESHVQTAQCPTFINLDATLFPHKGKVKWKFIPVTFLHVLAVMKMSHSVDYLLCLRVLCPP